MARRSSRLGPAVVEGRYVHIDALRAVAVMLVVVAHSGFGHIVPGGSGVTIFFAISGFIITNLQIRELERTGGFRIGSFYQRRLFKIAPPFVVVVLIPSLIYAMFVPLDLRVLLGQTFFFYNWQRVNGAGEFLPGSNVVWSLAIEEQFYIVFALLWCSMVAFRWRSAMMWTTTAGAVLLSLGWKFVLHFQGAEADRIYYGTDTRLDGIAIGVLAALAYGYWSDGGRRADGLRRFVSGAAALPIAAVVYLLTLVVRFDWFRDTIRYPMQAVATCLVILFGLLAVDGRFVGLLRAVSGYRAVQVVGLASYSIYLLHAPVIFVIREWMTGLSTYAVALVAIPAGTLSGVVLWRLIELPLDPLRKRIGRPKSGSAFSEVTGEVRRE
ncbi:acyltransferase [Pseudonocardia tropica]|uniref:Acyltransferase n=2 Tax=Pseudonocardiaceae TaxID=2070 RepID=A0ABV1JXG1_9PSEU